MTLELFSTSAPAGLEAGSTGYCTVAMTRGLPRALAEQLEALSAYRPVFMPGDPREADNPVAWSHLRLTAGGRSYSVVSRTCFSGLDHTRRTNRFAHHVVLDGNDPRPMGGPGWLSMQPGFLEQEWDGEVRWLSSGRPLLTGESHQRGCPTWAYLCGDAGWAGLVLERLAEGQTVYLVYDPGVDILPLIAEVIHLLPTERRWGVTYSTYFTGLAQGVNCLVRGVVRGSQEAMSAPRGATVDLAQLRSGAPPASVWTEVARGHQRMPSSPAPAAGPAPGPYRPMELTPASGEGEVYISDGPIWREGLSAPPPPRSAPMPPPGPVLVPIPPPDDEEEYHDEEDDAHQEAKKRVGMGVLMGVLIGLLLVGSATAVGILGYQYASTRGGNDKDKQANTDQGKPKTDGGNGGTKPAKKKEPVGALSLEVPTTVEYGKAFTITVGPTFLPSNPDDQFPWDEVEVTADGKKLEGSWATKPRDSRKFEVKGGLKHDDYTAPKPVKIRVAFAGNEKLEAGTSAEREVSVNKRPKDPFPAFQVVATKKVFRRGGPVDVEVKWTGKEKYESANWNQLTFKVNGEARSPEKPGKPGHFQFKGDWIVPHEKPYSIVGVYPEGDTHQVGQSAESQFHVSLRKATLKVTPLLPNHAPEKGFVAVSVQVTPAEGDAVPLKGTISLVGEKGGEPLAKTKLNDKGKAELTPAKLEKGSYKLDVVFTPEGEDYEPTREHLVVTVEGKPKEPPPVKVKTPEAEKLTWQLPLGTRNKDNVLKVDHVSTAAPYAKIEKLSPTKSYTFTFTPRKDAKELSVWTIRPLGEQQRDIEHRKDKLTVGRDTKVIKVSWQPAGAALKIEKALRPLLITFGLWKDKQGDWYFYHEYEKYDLVGHKAEDIKDVLVPGFKKALDGLHGGVIEIYEKDGKTPVLRYTIENNPHPLPQDEK